jgi:hypothetical protein
MTLYVPQPSTWDFVGSAECELETCDILLPVFAPTITATSDTKEGRQPIRPSWERAACECGSELKMA